MSQSLPDDATESSSSLHQIYVSQLSLATLAYLLLPNLIFVLSWLRFPWAATVGALTVLSMLFVAKIRRSQNLLALNLQQNNKSALNHSASSEDIESPRQFWRQTAFVFFPLCAFVLISGVGGFGYQSSDWEKHNSILRDLTAFTWPVQYDLPGFEGASLIYYFAYYLPAALVGKIAGWDAANVALILWTLAGFFLLSVWIALFVGKRFWWIGLILLAFGSYDWLAFQIQNAVTFTRIRYGLGMSPEYLWHMEQTWKWLLSPEGGSYAPLLQGLRLEYTSLLNSIIYVPQHSLAAWLATSVLMRRVLPFRRGWREAEQTQLAANPQGANLERALDFFVLALTPLWSAFVFVGCLPFLMFNEWQRRKVFRSAQLRSARSGAAQTRVAPTLVLLLASAMVFGVVALFFQGKQSDGLYGLRFVPALIAQQGSWIIDGLKVALFSLCFWAIQALILWFLIRMFPQELGPFGALFWFCVGILALTPLLAYGSNNDWIMRVSMPALWAFRLLFLYGCVLLLRQLASVTKPRWAKVCAVGVAAQMVCALMLPAGHLSRNFSGWYNRPDFAQVPRVINLYDSKKGLLTRSILLRQYLGNPNRDVFRLRGKTSASSAKK